jgi:hypothetical protein
VITNYIIIVTGTYLKSVIDSGSSRAERLGLPQDWAIVEGWAAEPPPYFRYIQSERESINNTGETVQGKKLPDTFWKTFPSREIPKHPSTRVDLKALESLVNKHKYSWTAEEKLKAESAVKSLKEGAPAHQKTVLPAAKMRNAPSAYEHADKLTEAVKVWVAGGIVAGPFKSPPLPDFRANCIMAVARKSKVRPVVNLSSPKGASFNDNI